VSHGNGSTRTLEIAAPALAPALAAASIGSDPYKLEPVSIGSDPYKLKPADAKAATVARTKPAQPPTGGSDPYKI